MHPTRSHGDWTVPSPRSKMVKVNRVLDDRFLIITGLAGSGKTSVSRFLEDFGYYCLDNLPAKLIPSFVDLWRRREVEIEKVALTLDIREASFLTEFPKVLRRIRQEINPRVIFLDASDETLIKRFSESRRPHPIKDSGSIRESVALERKRLAEVKNMSDEVINTSDTNINDLKKILTRRFVEQSAAKMQVVVVSFGYKYGLPKVPAQSVLRRCPPGEDREECQGTQVCAGGPGDQAFHSGDVPLYRLLDAEFCRGRQELCRGRCGMHRRKTPVCRPGRGPGRTSQGDDVQGPGQPP